MHLFSGRSDPVWTLSPVQARNLVEIWGALPVTQEAISVVPRLGYTGCFVSDRAGRVWRARGGIVSLSVENQEDLRTDPNRRFERAVLATAAPEMLPPGLADEFE